MNILWNKATSNCSIINLSPIFTIFDILVNNDIVVMGISTMLSSFTFLQVGRSPNSVLFCKKAIATKTQVIVFSQILVYQIYFLKPQTYVTSITFFFTKSLIFQQKCRTCNTDNDLVSLQMTSL